MYVDYLVCFAYIYTIICIDVYSFIGVHMRCYLFAARCDRAVVSCNTCLDASILILFLFVEILFLFVDFEWWDVRVVMV
jgi:hypothetical protein